MELVVLSTYGICPLKKRDHIGLKYRNTRDLIWLSILYLSGVWLSMDLRTGTKKTYV